MAFGTNAATQSAPYLKYAPSKRELLSLSVD